MSSKIPVSPSGHLRVGSVGRGHQLSRCYPKPEHWFFAIQIAEHFEFRPQWYRQGAAAALVLEHYVVLRSVLRAKPHLRRCRTRCRHCRIFFLTHRCNLKRRGLIRCPFGCRAEHRRREAMGRSRAHYSDQQGKQRKREINQRRCRLPVRPVGTNSGATPKASPPLRPRKSTAAVPPKNWTLFRGSERKELWIRKRAQKDHQGEKFILKSLGARWWTI